MKRIAHYLIVCIIITSCKNKKYTFELTSAEIRDGVTSTDTKIKNEIIEAANDSLAYEEGYTQFKNHWEVYKGFENTTFSTLPISFKVLNKEGIDISTKLSGLQKIRIQESVLTRFVDSNESTQKRIIDPADEKKAFGPVTFGMAEKAYEKLKGWSMFQKIGNHEYTIHPSYNKGDSLYMLEILGYSDNATYYDTKIKYNHDNLVSIIESKYGTADAVGVYPSFLSMKPGYIQWSHTWQLGDKVIKIGVGERDATYYPVCWIYRKSMKENIDQREVAEMDANVKKDGSKF